MGSVISDIDCPRCGQEATEDYYYKTDEVYIMCSQCGYSYAKSLIIENGKIIEDEDGKWIYDIREKFPYGTCTITYNTNKKQLIILEDDAAVKSVEDMIVLKKLGIDHIVISYFNGQEIVTREIDVPKGKRVYTDLDPYGEEDWEY